MTRAEWERLLAEIRAAWPGQLLTPSQEALYFDVLEPLSADSIADALLACVRDGARTVPSAGDLFLRARDLERLRDDEPAGAGATQPIPVTSASHPGPAAADHEAPRQDTPGKPIPRRWVIAAVGIGVLLSAAGFGLGWGTRVATGPDESSAFAAGEAQGLAKGRTSALAEGRAAGDAIGFRRGQLAGYRSGRAAGLKTGRENGYADGYDKGRQSVWGSLATSPPASGKFHVIRTGNDYGIASWFPEPIDVGDCVRLTTVTVLTSFAACPGG